MIQFVLMDIEGTTTSIAFVHEVLFPYAAEHLPAFIQQNQSQPAVKTQLEAVRQTVLEEEQRLLSDAEVIQQLLQWIKEDRKHTALKALQGLLWNEGYISGAYQGHLYPDVLPVWKKWAEAGIGMGIYSSGSVPAQKLLFGYSVFGDLTSYLSAYFDTRTGHKREEASYHTIQQALGHPAEQILFLSDIEAELDAAKAAGFSVLQLVRPGTQASLIHPRVEAFDQIVLS